MLFDFAICELHANFVPLQKKIASKRREFEKTNILIPSLSANVILKSWYSYLILNKLIFKIKFSSLKINYSLLNAVIFYPPIVPLFIHIEPLELFMIFLL